MDTGRGEDKGPMIPITTGMTFQRKDEIIPVRRNRGQANKDNNAHHVLPGYAVTFVHSENVVIYLFPEALLNIVLGT